MAKNYCSICKNEIGILSYSTKMKTGEILCKDCALKTGIYSNYALKDEVPFETIKDWYYHPEKQAVYLEVKRQKEEVERKKAEAKAQEELEKKKKEEEAAKKAALERERRLFPEGRVHVAIKQVSFTNFGAAVGTGNMLDNYVQQLQDKGCKIMNVSCYASGQNNNYVQAVVVYRGPNNCDEGLDVEESVETLE